MQTVLYGADELMNELSKFMENLGGGHVDVGFVGGKYSDSNLSVAHVAFLNEFGRPEHNQPPRPFFRTMISEKSPGWGLTLSRAAQATNFNGKKALELLGEEIRGQLIESINNFDSVPLAAATIAAKGFDKQLVDSGKMKNSVVYMVSE